MSKERELTIDELEAVSGGAGAGPTCTDIIGCALIGLLEGGLSTSGGGLVHETIHAK